jgi:hypothetical protein
MAPHAALAVCFPTVADTWHPHRNGNRTPHNTSGKNAYQAWWRCVAGHEWQESVSGRTNKPRWKRGDVAACRVCVGYHVIVAFDCGHTTEARAEFVEPERGCPACRKLRWAQRQADYAEQAQRGRAAFRLTEQAGRQLLDSLPAPDLPAPMLFEWRRTTLNELRSAIVRRDVYGVEDAIDTTSAACLATAAQLMPSAESLTAARSRLEPIKLAGKAHWPAGWLYYLGHATRTPEPGRPVDDALVADLTRYLSEQVRQVRATVEDGSLTAADVTGWLAAVIRAWAGSASSAPRPGWRPYRELALPVTPEDNAQFGRCDLIVMRDPDPDLVIEIDATENAASAAKLEFARDAGAVPLWMRWRGGRVQAPAGVRLIDLIEQTRGLA